MPDQRNSARGNVTVNGLTFTPSQGAVVRNVNLPSRVNRAITTQPVRNFVPTPAISPYPGVIPVENKIFGMNKNTALLVGGALLIGGVWYFSKKRKRKLQF